ncbi:hypothetical protein [Nonomuraea jabiensis]|uniref:hypothetical protein n=1 Tax=Nonomuraea jabiensis TaxID=882448 RepID=UPI0036B2C4FC
MPALPRGAGTSLAGQTVGAAVIVDFSRQLLNQGTLGPVAMIAALSVSSAIVDVSPFSTTGALLVANVRGMERDAFYRRLLAYDAAVAAVGPLAAWGVLVAPGWLGRRGPGGARPARLTPSWRHPADSADAVRTGPATRGARAPNTPFPVRPAAGAARTYSRAEAIVPSQIIRSGMTWVGWRHDGNGSCTY